jgi:uncharacterized membrane protein YqjE
MDQALYGNTVAAEPRSRLGRIAGSLLRQSRAVSSDYLLLAVLDARSAAVRFAWMLCSGVAAAILLVTAWLAVVAAGIVWMLGSGASWVTALFVAAALNVVAAAFIAFRMRGMFSEPPFAATLRQLRGEGEAPVREPS